MSEWPINWLAVVDEAVRLRKKEGLTQAGLASLAGVSRPTVVSFEQGEVNLQFERVIAILEALGLFVQPGRADSLQSFIYDAQQRFAELTKDLPDDHPTCQPLGHSEQAYSIEGVEQLPTLSRLRQILERAPRTSGWSPFWVPTKETIKPQIHEGVVECWLGRPNAGRLFSDAAHSDYWQVGRDGTAYLQRGYQEDAPDLDAGTFFDLTLPIWRTAEILSHAAWLAGQLGAAGGDSIRLFIRYTGLAGRELVSWAKPSLRLAADGERARSTTAEINGRTSADEIANDLEAVVGRLVRPLYERFDGYDPPDGLIAGQVAEFRRNAANFQDNRQE
jgi:transcriptional regulator with XRE-family HTH domain